MNCIRKIIGYFQGQPVEEVTFMQTNGAYFTVINYGATVQAIGVPDRGGKIENIALSAPSLSDLIAYRPYYGAVIGRVGGRISQGTYEDPVINQAFELDKNENSKNHLHGGFQGLDTKLWQIISVTHSEEQASIVLETHSFSGECGYPGAITVRVTYTWTADYLWRIQYEARSTERTLFNPTNHIYFNLSGQKAGNILDHTLCVHADHYVPLDEQNLPLGYLAHVQETDFDLRSPRLMSDILKSQDAQISARNGLDHPFYLNDDSKKIQAEIYHEQTGRLLQMSTDAEAVVIYSHNSTPEEFTKYGDIYQPHAGVTLETQALPDAVNQEDFGSIFLNPNEKFTSQTEYQFLIR